MRRLDDILILLLKLKTDCSFALSAMYTENYQSGYNLLYLLGRVTAATRGLMQRVEAHIPGHHNNLKYLRHMFPGASLREVESSIASFGRLLDRFSRVRARKLFENVFEITSD